MYSNVISSPRHCSVPISVTQFDFMQLVMLYTMESFRLLVSAIQTIDREHFFTVIENVQYCNFLAQQQI